MELTNVNPDINNVDEKFYTYIFQQYKEYDLYLINCQFKIVLNDDQKNTWIKSNFFNNKTMISWKNYLKNVIDVFFFKKKVILSTILMN